jgi:polynucleotide 5'-kinase involved in rRNA processing
VALVGPYGSGKTTLLESILSVTGAIQRKGSVPAGNTVGDSSPEARHRQMSVEMNCATTRYLDESFTFLDCPGSIEFLQETSNVLPGIDAAIVVCEPEAHKAAMLQPYLKRLADPARAVRQQDRQSDRCASRASGNLAAGGAQASRDTPDSDLEERDRHGIYRSRA